MKYVSVMETKVEPERGCSEWNQRGLAGGGMVSMSVIMVNPCMILVVDVSLIFLFILRLHAHICVYVYVCVSLCVCVCV